MAVTVTAILKRREELKAERDQYLPDWRDIGAVTMPHRRALELENTNPGEKQTTELFDSTAIDSVNTLAASIHGTMTPSTQPWLSLTIRQEELNDLAEVKDWLEDNSRRIDSALRASNWNTSVHEWYLDLVGPSATACMFIDEKTLTVKGGFSGFRFQTYAPAHYMIAEDAEGRVDTVYAETQMSARAIVKKWGDKAGAKVTEKAKDKPDHKYTVLHAVQPRTDRAYKSDGAPKGGSQNLPWASCYIVIEEKHKLDEGGYHEFPFMVARWSKTAGEVYGRGPSHTAYPDIKTLNVAKEFLLKAAPLAMFPPTVERDDAVIGEPDLTPAGRNVVSGSGPLADLFNFMQTGVKIDVSQIVFAELRQGIRRIYFSDQLELQDGPQMTATEVQVRYELMQRLLGPTTGRIEGEGLNPFVERAFGLMSRANAFLPMPDALAEAIEDADLDVEYEGPLARAQRTVELTAQDRLITFVNATTSSMLAAGVPPTQCAAVWDVLDLDKMIRDRAEILGLRSDSLRDARQVEEQRAVRAEQEAERAEMEKATAVSEMARNAAPALTAIDKAAQPQGKAA